MNNTKNNSNKAKNNKAKNTNNVKVYTNNKNNVKLTNGEFNSMRKWMKNEDNKSSKKGNMKLEEIMESYVKNHSMIGNKTKYAHMTRVKEISELPESLQKLDKKYDKGVPAKNYEVHVFEVQSMDDINSVDVEADILSAWVGPKDTVITKIYKVTDQNLRLYDEPEETIPKKTIVQQIKNMFTVLSGGKVNEFKPKERKSKKIKEGDVIVERRGRSMSLESESIGDNAKLGIIYLIKTM